MSGARAGECHRAHRHAGRGQLPPLGGLHHRTDCARGNAGTAELLTATLFGTTVTGRARDNSYAPA